MERAKDGEKFTTLDDRKNFRFGMLMYKRWNKTITLAGIMGS